MASQICACKRDIFFPEDGHSACVGCRTVERYKTDPEFKAYLDQYYTRTAPAVPIQEKK